jgi:serine-type D-Ala-D-Ala carboxypeptidase (penicillin-binding protein 5/6)
MIKKLVCILLFLAILIPGCSNQKVAIPHFKNEDSSNFNTGIYQSAQVADFYGDDVVVVPTNRKDQDSNMTATSSLLINKTDNQTIYADNIYKQIYPASLTKLVTALVVLEKGNFEDIVTVSYNASHIMEDGAKLCGLKEGDKVPLDTLLNMFLLYSGNDAGIALAEHVAGTEEEFANLMNETAKRVGAVHSNFVNPHGLHHDDHYTTSYDLYLIFNELLKFDEFLPIIDSSSYFGKYVTVDGEEIEHQFMNTNRYLLGTVEAPDSVTVVGGKTGTTSKAGSCLILYSKDESDKEYISIVIQASSGIDLYNQMTYLLNMVK